MHSVSKHVRHGVVTYLFFSFTFSLLLVAGAITALTFRKLKQITKSHWAWENTLHRAVSLHGFLVHLQIPEANFHYPLYNICLIFL